MAQEQSEQERGGAHETASLARSRAPVIHVPGPPEHCSTPAYSPQREHGGCPACSRFRQRGSPPRAGQRRDGRALVAAHHQRASRAFARLVSSDRHAYRGHVLGPLAALLLQAPLVPGGAATPDPPAMATSGAQEWNLGGVLRIKRSNFLRWQPVQHHTSLRWSLILQPIFLVEVEPLRPRWNRLVLSFDLADTPAAGGRTDFLRSS